MPIKYPTTRKQVVDRIKTDIKNELPDSDPFLRNSYIASVATGVGGAVYDEYLVIKVLNTEMFPDTATGEFADRWGSYRDFVVNHSSISNGFITATGVPATVIPVGSLLQSRDGIQYKTKAASSIQSQVINIITLVLSGTTATAITASAHHFANGNLVTISGAVETEYNLTASITVESEDSFTYQITGTPASPATGTIKATLSFANIEVESLTFGEITNQDSGATLTFSTFISGLDSNATVQFTTLSGGTAEESDVDFKKRYMYGYRNPISYFNVTALVNKAKTVPGVTRVFVQEITPDVGQVTIYFMMDNRTYPIPTLNDVKRVKDELLKIKPAHVNPADMIVSAPTPKLVSFKFTTLTPNSDAMREAIKINLEAFFAEVPVVGQFLSTYSYQSAINDTVNPETGEFIEDFVLAYPLGSVPVASHEIAILDTNILWP